MTRRSLAVLLVFVFPSTACGGWGGGSSWVQQPLVDDHERGASASLPGGARGPSVQPRTIGAAAPRESRNNAGGGRVLGLFRNTYYDFPREADFAGDLVDVMSGTCQPIAKVPRGFHDAVCVQGSGALARGGTISFARRDCECAQICPRTQQKICFDALDPSQFPWGRGAAGRPIAPLRTIAADTSILPLGTVVYLPELDGVGDPVSDGCFVVEDRGVRVRGEHVDVFTGHPGQTATINREVPSNQGVTVIVDAPRCASLRGAGG